MPDVKRRRNRRRRRAVAAGCLVAVGTASGLMISDATASGAVPYRTARVTTSSVSDTLAVSGTIQPVREAAAGFQVSGTVAALDVEKGQVVAAGQTLATLDTTSLQAAVTQAEDTLAAAQAKLTADEDNESSSSSSSGSGAPTGSTATEGASGSSASTTASAATTAEVSSASGTDAVLTTATTRPTTGGSPISADEQAVVEAQHAVDSDLQTASVALSSMETACSTASGTAPSTTSTTDATTTTSTTVATATSTTDTAGTGSTTSTTGADPTAGCTAALAAAGQAEQQVATDQKSLQAAETTLAAALSAAASAATPASSSKSGSSGSSTGSSPGSSSSKGRSDTSDSGTGPAGTSAAGAASGTSSPAASGSTQKSSTTTTTDTDTPQQIAGDESTIDSDQASLVEAQQSLAAAKLVSPVSGTVESVGLAAGQTVSAGSTTDAVTVLSEGSYEVTATLTTSQVKEVAVGQKATVTADSSTGVLDATVTGVGPVESSGSSYVYPVVVTITSVSGQLPSGGAAHTVIELARSGAATVVPTSAVHTSGTTSYVYLYEHGGEVRTPVKVGLVGATYTQITAGVTTGATVILADPSQAVPASSSNTSSIRQFTGTGGGPPSGGGPPGV